MGGADGRPFLARVRDVLVARVDGTSLRQVAREVGVTPTGLQYFLDGGDPQERTRRKLEAWYLWSEAGLELGVDAGLEALALDVLVRGLPPGERGRAAMGALAYFERVYADAGQAVPAWVADLRARLAPGDTSFGGDDFGEGS